MFPVHLHSYGWLNLLASPWSLLQVQGAYFLRLFFFTKDMEATMQTPEQKQLGDQQKKAAGLNELQGSPGGTGIENIGDQDSPAGVSTAVSSGAPIDDVGGAGMGKAAGESDIETDQAQPAEKRAVDLQDRRDQTH
jgi:hypothetical protein